MGRRPKVTREDVLKTAREVFIERGFAGATLAAIAARLDVSPAALLRHAPTKEALYAAAMSSGPGDDFPLPMEFLAEVPGEASPREVLARIAEAFVPFAESKLTEQISRWMRAMEEGGEVPRGLPLPFDPDVRPTPPQRGLTLVADYLRRAQKAGRLRVKNPRAAALAFMGSLHAYVFLNRVLKIADPPIPLDTYLDTLLEVWSRGAILPAKRKPGP